MNPEPYRGCSGGCGRCPRMRRCFPAAALPAEPESAPAEAMEPALAVMAVQTAPSPDSGTTLAAFLAQNPKQGALRVQAFRGDQALPLPGVRISVEKTFDDGDHVFFQGETDASGLTGDIPLPAPDRSESLRPDLPDPSAAYRLRASFAEYEPLETTVDIFEDVRTVQPVQLRLRSE